MGEECALCSEWPHSAMTSGLCKQERCVPVEPYSSSASNPAAIVSILITMLPVVHVTVILIQS